MTHQFWRRTSAWLFNLVSAVALASIYNVPVWKRLSSFYPPDQEGNIIFIVSLFFIITGCFFLVLNVLTYIRLNKILACLVFLVNPFVLYFINEYSVMVDSVMIENVLQTDAAEAKEIISWTFLTYAALGIMVSAIIWRFKIIYPNSLRLYLRHTIIVFANIAVIASLMLTNFQAAASMVRNHKELRYLVLPNNYVYGTIKVIKNRLPTVAEKLHLYEAKKDISWKDNKKKTIFILVIGETARADNFSLYGYNRQTNPKLTKDNVIVFKNMLSCGTSTAVSLPCMFSSAGKNNFDSSMRTNPNNMFQLANRAGFKTLWIDNSSGCKGLCDNIETISMRSLNGNEAKEVYDADMIPVMNKFIQRENSDAFIVMHQMGSHGPAYYLRSPQKFWQYTPVCKTERLDKCLAEEIRNAYDNTILYTDFFLSETIRYLESLSNEYNVALVYVSDHGESLGENNLYLHGLPYSVAPHEQKHVPFILWASEDFNKEHRIDTDCLRKEASEKLSHDNLFHSVLDVLDINSPLVEKKYSIFSTCQRPSL